MYAAERMPAISTRLPTAVGILSLAKGDTGRDAPILDYHLL
jgi:hypothetical protein